MPTVRNLLLVVSDMVAMCHTACELECHRLAEEDYWLALCFRLVAVGLQIFPLSIATKNQPFSQGGWKGVAELVVGFERKLGCLFLSIVPTRLPIFHEGSCDTIARSSARFHGCRS